MAIITYPLNGIEYGAEDVETYLCTRTSGVYAQDGMFAATAIGGRQVQIAPGLAWIKNATYKGKSICVDAQVVVDIAIADTSFARIDRIVLRFDATANGSSIVVKEGSPASKPVAPEVSRTESLYELALCDVSVPAGSVTVDPQHLSNKLLDESVCGIMRDAVTGIPTQDLYNEFTAWETAFKAEAENWRTTEQQDFSGWRNTQETAFDEWQTSEKQAYQEWLDSLEKLLNDSVAGNLLAMIEATDAKVAQKADKSYTDEQLALKATKYNTFNAELSATAWTGSEPPFSQQITIEGLKPGVCSIVGLPNDADNAQRQLAAKMQVWCTEIGENSATFTVAQKVDTPLTVQVIQNDNNNESIVNVWPFGNDMVEYITEEITTSKQWKVPTNVTKIEVRLFGGGGSGTYSGGGGGHMAYGEFDVSADAQYAITIGAGGVNSTITADSGNDGGSTSFGDLLVAYGGKGSLSNEGGSGGTGGGGCDAIWTGNCTGGDGSYGGGGGGDVPGLGGVYGGRGGAVGVDSLCGQLTNETSQYYLPHCGGGGYHANGGDYYRASGSSYAGGGGGGGWNGGTGGEGGAFSGRSVGGGGGGYGTKKLNTGTNGGTGYGAGGGEGNGAQGICIIKYRKP